MSRILKTTGLYGLLAIDYCAIVTRRLFKSDIHANGFWLDESWLGHYFDDSMAEVLSQAVQGKTLIDFGCGKGKYVDFLTKRGIACRGYDGNPLTPQIAGNCAVADLTQRLEFEPADWVMSLEVAEHIPAELDGLCPDNVTRHARQGVVLSWALPGQPGRGHVNCQSNDYVRSRLKALGFIPDPALEQFLRKAAWLPWFRYTVMAFSRESPAL